MQLLCLAPCAANHNYGGGNPMRPHRVRLTHSLVANYGLNSKMYVHRPQARSPAELEQFHCDGAFAGVPSPPVKPLAASAATPPPCPLHPARGMLLSDWLSRGLGRVWCSACSVRAGLCAHKHAGCMRSQAGL